MAYDPKQKLSDLMNEMTGNKNTELHILQFFRLTRHLIESMGTQDNFKALKFYCDWFFHPNIDRNRQGWEILSAFDHQIVLHKSSSADIAIPAVNKCLLLAELRSDLISVFQSQGLDSHFFDVKSNWVTTLRGIFRLLENVAISFDKGVGEAITPRAQLEFDAMVARRVAMGDSPDFSVKRIWIEEKDRDDGRRFCVQIRIQENAAGGAVQMSIPISTTEPDTAFAHP